MKRASKIGVDRISKIPECILHQIMSHLSAEEIVRTSILSKSWYSINKSYPDLEFDRQNYGTSFKQVVYNSLRHFSQKNLLLQSFSVCIWWDTVREPSLYTHLDSWIELALENKVTELKIALNKLYTLPQLVFSSKTLTLVELGNSFLDQPLSEFTSLKRLVLRDCHINDDIILKQGDCPLLEELELIDCYGFSSVHISDLLRLCTIKVDMDIDIDETADAWFVTSQSIQNFTIRVHPSRPWSDYINISGCHHLKFLYLYSKTIIDQEFHSLLLQLPLLEELHLLDCHSLRRINISSSPRLKTLQVCCPDEDYSYRDEDYSCLEMIEIATPSLKTFIFSDTSKNHCEIKVSDCCCGLKTLALLSVSIIKRTFEELLSKFAQLENLWIFACPKLQQKIKIPNLQLKRLHVVGCYEWKVVEVCSPNLSEFYFTGNEAPEFYHHAYQTVDCWFERDQALLANKLWYSRFEDMLSTTVGVKDELLLQIICGNFC